MLLYIVCLFSISSNIIRILLQNNEELLASQDEVYKLNNQMSIIFRCGGANVAIWLYYVRTICQVTG